jgi:murein DD-endopeptidase MepM/ murein hydrolase activator NlpD
MKKISISLPPKYRLEVKLTKSRELEVAPIFPDLGKIMRAKKGNKLSRFFIHIFEHKKAKKILPLYIALIIGTSAYMPRPFPKTVSAAEMAPVSQTETFITRTMPGVRNPIDTVRFNQKYSFFHPGIDFGGGIGDNIYPIMTGKVEIVEWSKVGYGLSIVVDHQNGYKTRYAHLSKTFVTEGQIVTNTEVIGLMGSTGHSTGPHLHFEVYEYGKTINPLTILPK